MFTPDWSMYTLNVIVGLFDKILFCCAASGVVASQADGHI